MASSISPTLISRDVPIRFSYPDPRPLIFSKYWYQVSIRYSDTLTNIFLDNTAALRKEDLHPSCSLIVFFCWNKVYTFICLFLILHMLLQQWPTTFLVLAGESVALHCDSRPSCTASLSVCVKLHGRVACLFDMCSTSPRLPVLHDLLYEIVTGKWSQCNVMQRW